MQDTNLIHREVHSIRYEKRGNEASKEVYRILLTKSNKTNRLRDEIYMLFILFFLYLPYKLHAMRLKEMLHFPFDNFL